MTRRALIIGSPDNKIPGVKKDIINYKRFFLSPLGGAWTQNEIVTLESPRKEDVIAQVNLMGAFDYSIIVFAGHGHHVHGSSDPQITLSTNVEMDSSILRRGAKKHTLILDCCRILQKSLLLDSAQATVAVQKRELNAVNCRLGFDKRISESSSGLVVLYACSFNETANESAEDGGYYSSEIIKSAENWRISAEVTPGQYKILDVLEAHDHAKIKVQNKTAHRQNPTRDQPRMQKYFPFAIIA